MLGNRFIIGSSALLSAACFLATPSMAAASSTLSVSHAPMIRAKVPSTANGHGHGGGHGGGGGGGGGSTYGWESSNWSGYALSSNTRSTYHDITGNWTVPSVSASSGPTYSSTWIGIDGFNNRDLIQTGTEQDFVNGQAQYNAWWEILPKAETPITTADNGQTATVKPGDTIYAHISWVSGNQWTIQIQDTTEHWTYTTTQTYKGPGTSAEWIQEAPTVGGQVATLANYGQVTMDPGTVNGVNPSLNASEDGAMVQNGAIVSAPSLPDGDTDGFNVAYGSKQPTPSGS